MSVWQCDRSPHETTRRRAGPRGSEYDPTVRPRNTLTNDPARSGLNKRAANIGINPLCDRRLRRVRESEIQGSKQKANEHSLLHCIGLCWRDTRIAPAVLVMDV